MVTDPAILSRSAHILTSERATWQLHRDAEHLAARFVDRDAHDSAVGLEEALARMAEANDHPVSRIDHNHGPSIGR